MKNLLTILLWIVLAGNVSGQDLQTARSYSVGDTLPDIKLGKYLVNDKGPDATLHDFRGKYVVLDFWERYCQPCINALPKLQSLQDKYRDSLQIVLITKDTEANVRMLLGRSEVTKDANIRLSFAVEEPALHRLFPHTVIPHVIIISPDGVIEGITHGEEITETNVAAMVAGTKKSWPLKKEGGGVTADSDTVMGWRSYLKRGGIGKGSFSKDSIGRLTGVHLEFTPINIYYKIFSYFKLNMLSIINKQRVIVDVRDTLTRRQYANADLKLPFFPNEFPYLHYNSRSEYNRENVYTYDLRLASPRVLDDNLFEQIFNELNNCLPIKAKVVKRNVTGWVIRTNDRESSPAKSKGLHQPSYLNFDQAKVFVKNRYLVDFVKTLRRFRDAPPFVDETGIDFPVDIEIDFTHSTLRDPKAGLIVNNPLDLEVLRSELARYGLYLEQRQMSVDVLMIHD
ncbi:TlpA family protein disulfide reductase [Parapedobacter koreensis]|uniref:Thiol-disulfide isomerase or thioredoxin n=1 Tax=Parapedobacter koreensis TaxID=332977 RepID=A0A1H7TX97_9SPHI|nr:TlpA disulfide reductase family protein [Parapedobacter koreensis]SEL89088.1 Thiol-disulfide isomerase or thioredoxin [Parapedobacter koreensis]